MEAEIDAKPWSHVFVLQAEGAKPSLFAVHAAAGGSNIYRRLASRLGAERPLYGLRASGLRQGQLPLATIELVTERYMADIRSVQPRGPYFLLGYSTGGVMAYEIAQRFRSQGDSVPFLGLIDTALPEPKYRDVDDMVLLAGYFRMDVPQTVEQLRGASREEVLEYFAAYARHFDMMPPGAEPGGIPRLFDVITANLRIANRYEPKPYAGTVTFFSATSGKHSLSQRDRAWGWDKLARDFEVLKVPGDHFSMMRDPEFVAILADGLRASLDRAEKQPQKSRRSDKVGLSR